MRPFEFRGRVNAAVSAFPVVPLYSEVASGHWHRPFCRCSCTASQQILPSAKAASERAMIIRVCHSICWAVVREDRSAPVHVLYHVYLQGSATPAGHLGGLHLIGS